MIKSLSKIKDRFKIKSGVVTVVLTAIVYFIGYLKYYVLLLKLEINTPVNDVFPVLSIFVSGITMLISLLYVPFFSFCIIYFLLKQDISKNIVVNNKLKVLCIVLVIICALTPILVKDFLFTPFNISPLLCLAIIVVLFYLIKKVKKINRSVFLIVFVCWTILIGITFYFSLPSADDVYYKIDTSTRANLDSGTSGYIITDYELSSDSVEYIFSSGDEVHYQTYGILLSVHDDNYYFYTDNRLYVLSNNKVVMFNEFLHSASR